MTSSSRASGSLLESVDEKENGSRSQDRKHSGAPDSKKLVLALGVVGIAIAVLGFAVYSTYRSFRDDPRRMAFYALVADSVSGEVIPQFPLPADGKGYPAVNPKTGNRTIFPAEACYWTKDGKAKLDPNYVILNTWLGKKGPTRCPECGKTVVRGNPMPPDALMQQAWDAAQSTNKR
ncbi:MAG: hypothetical protein JNM86_12445 [Phycisphaerae bacterium]|nr:hypothetical protein [Phycisphaerae bacterium]